MAKKMVPETQNQHAMTSVCVPLYRLQVVKERHSPLYGASKMSDSHDVSRFLRANFDGRPHEEFLVLFLDAKHAPVGYQVVSVGSLTLSIVHPREAFKTAVCMNAAAVIFAHNLCVAPHKLCYVALPVMWSRPSKGKKGRNAAEEVFFSTKFIKKGFALVFRLRGSLAPIAPRQVKF